LFEIFKEKHVGLHPSLRSSPIAFFLALSSIKVRTNITLSILVLFLWTLSLLQFCLAFTISRSRKNRMDLERDKRSLCNPSDFWGMLISLILQHIPFLSFRAVLIFHYRILSYSTVFFTSENGLIIILQWYRITVILTTTTTTIQQERWRYSPGKTIEITHEIDRPDDVQSHSASVGQQDSRHLTV
jgi:hypothetical protein